MQLAKAPGTPLPGGLLLQTVVLSQERYRYPQNLPKVAATGGPQCTDLPKVPFQKHPPFVITDVPTPTLPSTATRGILLNSDGLDNRLCSDRSADRPATLAQIGQPG